MSDAEALTVGQAKEIAAKWVREAGSRIPGYEGAFFHGSINWMNPEDPFPASSDVDLALVSNADPRPKSPGKFLVDGVLLQVGVQAVNSLNDVEETLADHRFAGTFSKDCVIADSTGRLSRLQEGVSKEFAGRKWVLRRCENALATVNGYFDALDPEMPFYDQATVLSFGIGNFADLLTVAGLRNTTVRKKYAVARELLADIDKLEVYESILSLFGCAELTSRQVFDHLSRLSDVFDAACLIDKSGYRFADDISASARSTAIDGSRELIDQGHHRDAVFWIVATYSRCMAVFDQYGATGDLEKFRTPFDDLLKELGIETFEKRLERRNMARQRIPYIWDSAQAMIAENPAISD